MSENKEMIQQEENIEEKFRGKQKKVVISAVMVVVLLLIVAGTLAWFFMQRSAATVTEMGKPSNLSLVGANEGELVLNMSPSDSDADTAENGDVTVKRVFGVKSDNNHWLEIAHTTNTAGLTFKIYQATVTPKEDGSGEYTYSYDSTKPITGQDLNLKSPSSDGGRTADKDVAPFYGDNFQTSDIVQQNSIPLYWMSCQLPVDKNGSGVTYYYLEVNWTETQKESDVFYIFVSDSITQSSN